jgi:hypothetical protein
LSRFPSPATARRSRVAIGLALAPLGIGLIVALAHWRDAAAHPVALTGPVEARDMAPLHQRAELRRLTSIMLRR